MKIKFNWGHGIVLGIIGFISFILFFVVQMLSSKDYDHHLVTANYYEKEMYYQNEIDAIENYAQMSGSIEGQSIDTGYQLKFPERYSGKKLNGTVFLYRPSNQSLDFDMPLTLSESSHLLIPSTGLVDGRWNIKITWEDDGIAYQYEEKINFYRQ